jgi:hypothetical protein
MRGNQLPVSAARWQHWPHICIDFYFVKHHKIVNNSATNNAREKICKDLDSLEPSYLVGERASLDQQGTTYPNTQALTVVVILSFLGYLCCITPKEGKTISGNVSVTDRGTTLGVFHHLGYFWRLDMIFL